MNKFRLIATVLGALALVALLPGAASAKSGDRDRDGVPDRWERRHGMAVGKQDGARDRDHDGLSNLGEFRTHSDPRDPDTDNDGTEDGDEDADRDGVDNANELDEGTSPTDRDSDDDGRQDGIEDADHDGLDNAAEDRTGNDPDDGDTDNDGTEDGDEHAGTIASFADGLLTVTLADGGSVTGRVTADTEISCQTEDEHEGAVESENAVAAKAARAGDEPSDDQSDEPSGHDAPGAVPSQGNQRDEADEQSGDDEQGTANDGPGTRDEHEGDEDDVCGVEDLVAGTRVHEAELHLTADGAVFVEIELIK
jgi:hypothetical protein